MAGEKRASEMRPFGICSGSTSSTATSAPSTAMTVPYRAFPHALSDTQYLSIPNPRLPSTTKSLHSNSTQFSSTPLLYTTQPNRNLLFLPVFSPNTSL
jgi:hypothetical protein